MAKNSIVLSYGDYVLRQSDMDILKTTAWLNDTLIGFYFEYLSRKHPDVSGFKYFGPEITQCIKLGSKDDLPVFIGDRDRLTKVNFMFWPVNDSTDPHDHFGGSHWSLLVFSRGENFFGHYDSTMTTGGGNDRQARRLYEKLAPFISPSYRNMLCDNQRNGYDCGVHVICNADLLSDSAAKYGKIVGAETASAEIVTPMRNRLIHLVDFLASTKST